MSIFDPTITPPGTMAGAQFQPYSVTTGTGSSSGGTNEQGGLTSTSALNPQLSALSGQATQGAGQTQDYLQSALEANQGGFQAQPFDVNQATDQYFQQGMNVLNPAFQQQNTNLAQSLQGSGRGGLRIASGALGAGQGGMLNPDAYATGNAQSNAMANLYQQSRQSALGEQNQMFGQQLQGFGANQQQLQNLSGINNQQMANLGLFSGMENQLFQQGVTGEQIRSGAYAGSMYNPQINESLGSSIVGAGIGGLASNPNAVGAAVDGIGSAYDWGSNQVDSWFGGDTPAYNTGNYDDNSLYWE